MTTAAAYLARLDAALQDVPHGIASEIRNGIAEELTGLDADATARRIAQLGDPAEIAREAMDAGTPRPIAPIAMATPSPRPPLTRSRGYAIAAAIALGVGGFIVPFAGWFIGVVMVLTCGLWRTYEKLIAVLLPFVTLALMAGVVTLVSWLSAPTGGGEETNPLLPSGFAAWHSSILVSYVMFPVCGLWLLWRLRARAAR
ncbi:HAAS signaling domain-containing protein [Microbacterium sp. NPDC089987]|uniref:HAAS signaling domain-containing protein n=1 Tax=Microbacterium sp. NPDC089987 TaxID=3364202 RepID=UPI0038256BC9